MFDFYSYRKPEAERTWTVSLGFPDGSEVPLDYGPSDTLRETVRFALREASSVLGTDDPWRYSLVLYKRTVARGRERDRSYYLDRDRHGRLVGRE